MLGQMITSSTAFASYIAEKLGAAIGSRPAISVSDCGLPESSLIWLLPAGDVLYGIWDIPGTISRHYLCRLNVVGVDAAASLSICSSKNAGTNHSDGPIFLSSSHEQSPVWPHPGFVNFWSLICVCGNLFMCCCTVVEIVPSTLPGLSSLLCLPCSLSLSSSLSPSSPSSEHARSLRHSPIAIIITGNNFSGSLVVNPSFSAVLVSFCFCLIVDSASSNCFLAAAVSLAT